MAEPLLLPEPETESSLPEHEPSLPELESSPSVPTGGAAGGAAAGGAATGGAAGDSVAMVSKVLDCDCGKCAQGMCILFEGPCSAFCRLFHI